ncbi:HepT-like ribonuclease domain-containing protein [Polaromonas naphthalenivorans]|uniref:HepT-like ribonuclease domain-containing protein n=1 Tax=Polaromonas naphthalenivorans TaxID=216465 RepID=UPI0002E4FE79|nr:HepT-like ribonuclease domain-containing protein [Polaromonas naphthalenivorans]
MKAEQPDVPWREISGFRNILVHNYLGDIDPDTVATVVDRHLEPLTHAVSAMLHKP